MTRAALLALVLVGGCKTSDHCGPAATHHAELYAPLLQRWGTSPEEIAKFTENFRTLHCAKTDAPADGLDCLRDAATLEAAKECVNTRIGAGDWNYRTEVALGSVPVRKVPELDAYAARLVAAGQAAQAPPTQDVPMRCPASIRALHFLDFRLISAISRKKDQAVRHEDVLGDRNLEMLTAFVAKKTPNAEEAVEILKWIAQHADKALAIIHVAKLERPAVLAELGEGTYVGGTLDAAVSVIGGDGTVVCRTPISAESSTAVGYSYDPARRDKAAKLRAGVEGDFESKLPEALAKASATLLGTP